MKTRRLKTEPKHPRTQEPTNKARARRVAAAIKAYTRDIYGGEEDKENIFQDFLTDTFHLANQRGLVPDVLSDRALKMMRDEIAAEGSGN